VVLYSSLSRIIDRLHGTLADHFAAMSTQAAGNTYLPFVDLMRLETINEVTYRSTAQPFCPGGSLSRSMGRAYGGHVYAQAAWAAAQTVPEGFVLHVSYSMWSWNLPSRPTELRGSLIASEMLTVMIERNGLVHPRWAHRRAVRLQSPQHP
jgi:hypothetical protein